MYILYIYIYIYIYTYIYRYPCIRYKGWNYLFRSDPQKFSEKFQKLGCMREHCKLPYWGFGAKMVSKCQKVVYSLTLFGVRYKRIVELEVQTETSWFP